MELLRSSATEFSGCFPGSVQGTMDTFRHDSWQLLLAKPALAFRASLFLRSALRMKSTAETKFDTRISIGIGSIDVVAKTRISDSRGIAFTISGKGLDGMKRQ